MTENVAFPGRETDNRQQRGTTRGMAGRVLPNDFPVCVCNRRDVQTCNLAEKNAKTIFSLYFHCIFTVFSPHSYCVFSLYSRRVFSRVETAHSFNIGTRFIETHRNVRKNVGRGAACSSSWWHRSSPPPLTPHPPTPLCPRPRNAHARNYYFIKRQTHRFVSQPLTPPLLATPCHGVNLT